MSHHPILSPAIVQRVQSFAEELREASQLAAYLAENAASRLEHCVLEELQLRLEGSIAPLLEVLGGPEDEEQEVYPLAQGAPHFLPMALARVAQIGQAFSLLASLAASMSCDERLAIEYFAGRVDYLSETAGFIRSTVLEELPPLKAFDAAPVPAAFA